MALVLMGSFPSLNVNAREYDEAEASTIEDAGLGLPEGNSIVIDQEIMDREINIQIDENVIPLSVDNVIQAAGAEDGIQTFAVENGESVLRCGTVSDYLSGTDDYRLYGFKLSAGDYLQVRLSVPNNAGVSYFIPIFDSELNLLKRSTYPAYSNDMQSSEQSVGYLCTSDEEIIFGAYSLSGGSATAPFTLEFSITTNFSDSNEPNEHVLEAVALPFGVSGTTVSGRLNSPVDDDWYTFTIGDDGTNYDYNRTRLSLTSTSSLNVCKMEVYKIDSGMTHYGRHISEMEMKLSAGTYYVRVSSVNAVNDFYPADIPDYSLSIVPVGRVDGIKLMKYSGNDISLGKTFFHSGEEPGYVVKDDPSNNYIQIKGIAYYKYSPTDQSLVPARNVKLEGAVVNGTTQKVTYGTAVSGQDGFFTIRIYFGDAEGYNSCIYENEKYIYDYMGVMIYPEYDVSLRTEEYFYLLKKEK